MSTKNSRIVTSRIPVEQNEMSTPIVVRDDEEVDNLIHRPRPTSVYEGEIVETTRARALPPGTRYEDLVQAAVKARDLTGDLQVLQHAKDSLVGRPFAIVGWTIVPSDLSDGVYYGIQVATPDAQGGIDQFVMTTNEYGIVRVIEEAIRAGAGIIECPQGLALSPYKACPACGKASGKGASVCRHCASPDLIARSGYWIA